MEHPETDNKKQCYFNSTSWSFISCFGFVIKFFKTFHFNKALLKKIRFQGNQYQDTPAPSNVLAWKLTINNKNKLLNKNKKKLQPHVAYQFFIYWVYDISKGSLLYLVFLIHNELWSMKS